GSLCPDEQADGSVSGVETTDVEKFKARTVDAIRVLAFFKAAPGRAGDLEKVLLGLVGPTRGEPGNISYVLHRMDGNPGVFMFDEIWVSKSALDEHLKTPHIESLPARIKDLAQGPPRVEIYSEVTAGK
ncbi:MAG: putative quinol monooxygenase, partial [Nitrososphaera sp.]|uniref:putative quinol monooxygenase n=1 Tax=Nitrososphaera sp. TaxID=1971748 RepID=UPI003D6DB49B